MSILISKRFRGLSFALLALTAVSACKERDTILPGERVGIRPQEVLVVQNVAAPINLGNAVSNAEWTQKSFGASHVVPHLALSPTPVLRWSTDIGRGDSDQSRITSEPVVKNGVVYTLDAASTVRAVSVNDGATLWSVDLVPLRDNRGREGFGGGLAIDGDTLFVGSGFGEMLALALSNGAIQWRYAFDAPIRSAPTVADGQVYFVTRDDVAYALRANNGELAWSLAGPHATNAAILGGASPAVNGTMVVFPFSSGLVYGVATNGTGRWRAEVNSTRLSTARGTIGEISGDPVILGGRVYLANHAGETASVTLSNGNVNWSLAAGSLSPAAAIGNDLFVVSDSAQLMRINASNGAVLWAVQLPEFRRPNKRRGFIVHHGPIVAGGQVFVAGTDGELRAFDPVNGAATYTTDIPGGAASSPVIAAGVMYIQSQNGKLLAFQ